MGPKFAEAVEHGFEWTALSSSIVREFGSLPALVHPTEYEHHQPTQRQEGALQLARRLHNLWKTMVVTKPDGAVPFQELKQKILRTKPACASSIPFIHKFFVRLRASCAQQLTLTNLRPSAPGQAKWLVSVVFKAWTSFVGMFVCLAAQLIS